MDKAFIIFIKNPEAGKVKTRLAKDIGETNALTIYNYLLTHTRQISTLVEANRLLFYDESISLEDDWPESKFQKLVQCGDDLGLRMLEAFKIAAAQGNNRLIIIGSDCIELDSDLVEQAFIELENHDFVIGPAKDGGYYLLGMNYPEERVFKNKRWSTDTVYKDTLADIESLSKTVFVLPLLSDIDILSDLNQELINLIDLP